MPLRMNLLMPYRNSPTLLVFILLTILKYYFIEVKRKRKSLLSGVDAAKSSEIFQKIDVILP